MRAVLATAAVVGLVWVQAICAADEAQRLERIRGEIEEREARARELAEEAEGTLAELEAVDRQLQETRRSLKKLRQLERAAEKEREQASAHLADAERSLRGTRKALEKRLVALYKFNSIGGIPALYSAGSFQSFVRRREGLSRVLEQDSELFASYRASAQHWAASRDRSQQARRELAATRQEVTLREERVRQELVDRRNLVALLRSRSQREAREADELREAARRLEQALERMPGSFRPSPGKGLDRGAVPWPVAGSVRLGFGRQVDPEFGTVTLRTGIDIEAPRGTPVLAVGAGRVLFAGWFRGYGQIVIVDHGETQLTVSGYLDEIAVEADDVVEGGTTIGNVGETGSLSGPGLYFEIRDQGEPVDPRAWFE